MKFLFAIALALATVISAQARIGTEASVNNAQFGLNLAAPDQMQKHQLGTKLMKETVVDQVCVYDFSVVGGAISSINLRDRSNLGQACKIPKNAIIQRVLIDVITAGTTSASGTMALTAQSAGDLKAALAAASYTGLVDGVPVDTAATAIKLTADRTIIGTIATGALTAGKWNVHIRYVMSQ